jgi:multidrug resistance efflux pump
MSVEIKAPNGKVMDSEVLSQREPRSVGGGSEAPGSERRVAQALGTPQREAASASIAEIDNTPADLVVAETVPEPAPKKGRNLRRLILPLGAVVLLGAGIFGFNAYHEGQTYVSTENAQLTGTPVQVGAMNAGRVRSIATSVGATVHKGDPIAVIDLPSQVGTAQNGQPKYDFLGSGDSSVTVVAPLDGVVLAVPTTPGATVQAGQAVVTLVDPNQMWVNANIEETNVSRLKVGQQVNVHVDALGTEVAGRVDSITPATAGSFSLLPTSNSGGNFTKVTQLVPVRISVNLANEPVLLGSSVEVKIRVA